MHITSCYNLGHMIIKKLKIILTYIYIYHIITPLFIMNNKKAILDFIKENLQKIYNRNFDRNRCPYSVRFIQILRPSPDNEVRIQAIQLYINAMIKTYHNPDLKLNMYYLFGVSFYKVENVPTYYNYYFDNLKEKQEINTVIKTGIINSVIKSTINPQCILLLSWILNRTDQYY